MDTEKLKEDPRISHIQENIQLDSTILYDIILQHGYRFIPGQYATKYPPRTHDYRVTGEEEAELVLSKIVFCYCQSCRKGIAEQTLNGEDMSDLGNWKDGLKVGDRDS